LRRRSIVVLALLPIAAILLSLVTNLAANALPRSWRIPPLVIWGSLAVLATVTVGFEIRASRGRQDRHGGLTANADGDLDQAANMLAIAVGEQWRAEAAIRLLNRPEPIRVRWSSTGRPVSAAATAVLGRGVVQGRPVRLRLHGDADSIVNALQQLPRRQLVILGAPGAGKSVMSMLLTLGLLDHRGPGDPVPVLMALSSWDPGREHLWTWMARRIAEDYSGLGKTSEYGKDAPARLISTGRVLPVLDGLDEISPQLLSMAIDGIDSAIASGTPAVVTCRAEEYEAAVSAGGQVLTTAAVVEIEPVHANDVVAYLASTVPTGTVQWEAVFNQLRADPAGQLAAALSTPLMIWLARTVYSRPGSRPEELTNSERFPNRISVESHLLDALIPALYAHRPNPPGAPVRQQYRETHARRWLTVLACYLSKPETGKAEVRKSGQSTDLAWWQLYRLLPRAQRGLCVLIYSIPCAIIPAILVIWLSIGFTGSRIVKVAIVLSIGITAATLDAVFFRPPPPGRVQFRLPEAGELFDVVKSSLTFGLIVGVTIGSAGGIAVAVSRGPGTALKSGLISGAFAGLSVVCVGMLNGPVDTVRATNPTAVLSHDRVVTALTALLTGAGLGVIVAIASNPWMGLAASIPCGITLGIGMSSWGWFALARVWLGLRGILPWRLMDFLHDAYRRGVLRQAGAVYQFRHVRLQEWLVGDEQKGDS
jgi:hypothetical protein